MTPLRSNCLSLLLSLFAAQSVVAGTISGGGAELRQLETNPWFLFNTQQVTYCIDHDPDAFHIDPHLARQQIRSAFSFWKKFFRGWEARLPDDQGFQVATQVFSYVEHCQDDTDIRFQLGRLSPKQRSHLVKPSRYAGVAVMTNYDIKNLRAKGYIYLGADSGPDRMKNGPFHADPETWSVCNGLVVRLIAMHEIGHIFGLPHLGSSYLMSSNMAQDILQEVHALRAYPGYCAAKARVIEDDLFYSRNLVLHKPLRIDPQGPDGEQVKATVTHLTNDFEEVRIRDELGGEYKLEGGMSLPRAIAVELPAGHEVELPDNFSPFAYKIATEGDWVGTYSLDGQTYSTIAYTQNRIMSLAVYSPEKKRHLRSHVMELHGALK